MKQEFISKQFCIVVLWVGLIFPGYASEAVAVSSDVRTNEVTLEAAIRLAMASSPQLQVANGRVSAAGGRAYQSKHWSNPELTLSAEDWPTGGGGFSESKRLIGVAQSFPFPGKKRLDKEIGMTGVRVSEAELSLSRIELEHDIKSAFYQVLAARQLLSVQEELVRVSESLAESAQKRVGAGEATEQELLRAEIPLEQAKTDLSSMQRECAGTKQVLFSLMGRPDLIDSPIAGALAENANTNLLSQASSQWLPSHPGMVAATRNRERAEMELRRARLEAYPDVRAGLAGGEASGRDGDSIVQVSLSLPLPIIDRSRGRKQEALANVAIAEADRRGVEFRLLREWESARERLRRSNEQVMNYRERILPKANEALRLVRKGFDEGKFGFIDVLDTQRTASEVRLEYQRKLLDLNMAQADLESFVMVNSSSLIPH